MRTYKKAIERKKRVLTPEHRANISKANKNNPNISEGIKKGWETRKKNGNTSNFPPPYKAVKNATWDFVRGIREIDPNRVRTGYNDFNDLLKRSKQKSEKAKQVWEKKKQEVLDECN